MVESEFSKLLGASSQKIPELAEARKVAKDHGFRIALYGGPSREIIHYVLRNGKSLPPSSLHWLDWHWIASDFDILALPLEAPKDFEKLAPKITRLFSGNLFYRRVEFRLASRFFAEFPVTESHYEAISNIAISERGVETLSSFEEWGLAQFETNRLEFRINAKAARTRNPARDFKQVLRWIRLAAEHPHMELTTASRQAIRDLLSQSHPTAPHFKDLKIKEALDKIHWYSRQPPYTRELLDEFGINDSALEPLPRRTTLEGVRVGNEVRVFLKLHISRAQSFSRGAIWRERIVVKSTLEEPEAGKMFLGMSLSPDAILGVDVRQKGDEYEILTTDALAKNSDGSLKIDPLSHSQVRENLIHRFRFNQKLGDAQFRQLLALLTLKPT